MTSRNTAVKRLLLAVWDGIAVLGLVTYACLFLRDDGENEED